ncbi:MAG: pantothenate synthetase [Nitrosomonas sp.]|nr:MAG: pantothenate synthetase [Nitrosomonas sp.]
MERVTDISSLRKRLRKETSIAFVPTMGNLHEGHLSLVRTAKQYADCTVVSIFVNQLQFSPTEDYNKYPRTLEKDCALLKDINADVVFIPNEKILYPETQEFLLMLPPVAHILEGKYRPGFFRGVTTVVLKLFNIIQPQKAIFGKKDYQQLYIVDKMIKQLNLPVKIIACDTVRMHDGLAQSSRNCYLNENQRSESIRLYQTLYQIKKSVEDGNDNFKMLQDNAIKNMIQHNWKVDYITIRQRSTLEPAVFNENNNNLIVLGAAWLDDIRLIDNIEIHT